MKTARLALLAAALVPMFGLAEAAHADIYSYKLTGGSGYTVYGVGTAPGQPNTDATLTIDTVAGTGSVVGGAINAAFTGNFSGFTGGTAPNAMFNISLTPGSTLSYGGATYTPTAGHQPMLELMGNNINLWAVWSAAGCGSCATLGDTLKNIDPTGYTHTPAGGSSGGVAVPEPGMVGLMGLGVAALVARRRRGARAAGAVATA